MTKLYQFYDENTQTYRIGMETKTRVEVMLITKHKNTARQFAQAIREVLGEKDVTITQNERMKI